MKALGIADRQGWTRLATLQAYYTIAGRDLEREIAPLLEAEKLGLMVWSPLAGGLLSGKYGRDGNGPEGSRRASFDFPPVNKDRAFDCIDAMRAIADARGVSVARIALAWVLQRPFVMSVIIGAKTVEQLDDNLAATTVQLDADGTRASRPGQRAAARIPGLDDRASEPPRCASLARAKGQRCLSGPSWRPGGHARAIGGPGRSLVALATGALVANLYYAQPLRRLIGPEHRGQPRACRLRRQHHPDRLRGGAVPAGLAGGSGGEPPAGAGDAGHHRDRAWSAWPLDRAPAVLRVRLRHRLCSTGAQVLIP